MSKRAAETKTGKKENELKNEWADVMQKKRKTSLRDVSFLSWFITWEWASFVRQFR